MKGISAAASFAELTAKTTEPAPITPGIVTDGRHGALKGTKPPDKTSPQIDARETISSGKSTTAYHSTLFRTFNLTAESTYNFYVKDEQRAPTTDTSGTLSSLPRYVTLRWRIAEQPKAHAQKGIRPHEAVKPARAANIDVAITALANGYISAGVLAAQIVDPAPKGIEAPTRIDEDSFLLSNVAGGQYAADLVGDKSSEFSIMPILYGMRATVVNFIDPSVAAVFDPNRMLISQDQFQLTMAASLAKIIGPLEVISEFNQDISTQNPPPDFVGHNGTPSVSFIGYVIERHDMLPDGSMVLGRSITIDDPTQDEFFDQRVSYGGTYMYRMRSIVQWARASDIDFAGVSTIDRPTAFSSLVSPPLASFYAGDWGDWSRTQVLDTIPPEPPDEVTVRPVSWKGEIRVCWRVGNDPQLDLTNFKLLRATTVAGRVSDWSEIGTFVVANGSYVDRDVRPYEEGHIGYIYALYATSYHGVDSLLSDQMEARLSSQGSSEELPVIQAGVAGADRTVHPSGKRPPGPTEIKANRRLTFYCRRTNSGHPLRDSTYLVEVRSLSTGERAIVTLDVDATDIGVVDA